MGHVLRGLALLGSLVLPLAAHGAGSARARLSVSVRVVRSVVVSSRVLVGAATASSGTREVVLDASGTPVPLTVRWEQRPDVGAGARWITVLPDGAPDLVAGGGRAAP